MSEDKQNDMYSDLPMPKVAAVAGWLTCTFVCFAVTFAAKAITCAVVGWDIKLGIIDVAIAVIVGTIVHNRNRRNYKTKKDD